MKMKAVWLYAADGSLLDFIRGNSLVAHDGIVALYDADFGREQVWARVARFRVEPW